jgi:hypothetical protein
MAGRGADDIAGQSRAAAAVLPTRAGGRDAAVSKSLAVARDGATIASSHSQPEGNL